MGWRLSPVHSLTSMCATSLWICGTSEKHSIPLTTLIGKEIRLIDFGTAIALLATYTPWINFNYANNLPTSSSVCSIPKSSIELLTDRYRIIVRSSDYINSSMKQNKKFNRLPRYYRRVALLLIRRASRQRTYDITRRRFMRKEGIDHLVWCCRFTGAVRRCIADSF